MAGDKEGVIISSASLVLQRVDKSLEGTYSCSAYNIEGNATSQSIYIKIKCKFLNTREDEINEIKKINLSFNYVEFV